MPPLRGRHGTRQHWRVRLRRTSGTPPEYIGVFKKGDIVGYHRRNPEIEALQQAIDQRGASS